nr:YceI family protein [Allomuricauda sp.]
MSLAKFFLSVIFTLTLISAVQKQSIDTESSSISFVFKEKDVDGTIGDIRSESSIDSDDFTNSVLKGSVSLESLKTGNFLRDWHLMSKKFFNRNKQDRIYFESTEIKKENEGYSITGNLKIKGVSKSSTFKAKFHNDNLRLTGTINISDWDIIIEKETSKNMVEISMEFPFSRP